MIAYSNDLCSFKMSIENIIKPPFQFVVCLLHVWLICLTRSSVYSQSFPFAADSFFQILHHICTLNTMKCIILCQIFHKAKYKVALLSSRKLKLSLV